MVTKQILKRLTPAKDKNFLEESFRFAQWRVGAKGREPRTAMAESPTQELELLRLLARGNQDAFAALYERYQGPIYRFVLHMTGNSATAEEVTQEVFMLMIRKPKAYDANKGSLAGYLFGVARNLARRGTQKTQFDVPLEEETETDEFVRAGDLDILGELTQAELVEALRKAVLALPVPYREAVVLCDLEEMSYADAAHALACSAGTVASRLHRARELLKTKLSCQNA